MKIVTPGKQPREVFGWGEENEWFLSPDREVKNGRRPMNRYDSKNELLAAANAKGCKVTWLGN